jgi:hypothetical protein
VVSDTWEEIIEMEHRALELEKEIRDAKEVATRSVQNLTAAKEQLEKANTRLRLLREARHNQKDPQARVISILEFDKVRCLIEDNELQVKAFQAKIEDARKAGAAAIDQIRINENQMLDIEKRLGTYGKILKFPIRQEDGPPDDDS